MTKTLKLGTTNRVVPISRTMFLASWCTEADAEDRRDQDLAELAYPIGLILADDHVPTIAQAQVLAFRDIMSSEYPEDERPDSADFAWEQVAQNDISQTWRLYRLSSGKTVAMFVVSPRNVIE